MNLAEFLIERSSDEAEAEIARHRLDFLDGVPRQYQARAWAAHDDLSWTHFVRLSGAMRGFGWALIGTFIPPVGRMIAARYADHPDYQDEWRRETA